MQESIDKIKGAAAIIQNMVSTDEEVELFTSLFVYVQFGALLCFSKIPLMQIPLPIIILNSN